jgi:predicted  nucleic acid-binding Zn-ribbon protein
VATIEQNLLQLNLERDRFKNEFDKIPENPKTIAQKRRREELDRELQILNKNIASLKTKLRELDAI